ncbi:hypothetical protein [Mycolicibacterium duvalii]|uniref:PASTA domain-containing protein n=1 Tax=Mycolicibacterium duvalii TaxID=39688 RepID=A0A7I7K9M5_9MYCO|nr:hypothetical protein [Mycolicibacterium duvalii]BBX20314.1 hypothetical protein MDUV_51740 [Mycolicibacterium duvalii]
MALTARHVSAVLCASALLGGAPAAPVAVAQPAAGSESPGDTIRTLTDQGFDVRINWVAGTPSNIPLSQCTVTSVNTSAPPAAYVSINCPPDGSQ